MSFGVCSFSWGADGLTATEDRRLTDQKYFDNNFVVHPSTDEMRTLQGLQDVSSSVSSFQIKQLLANAIHKALIQSVLSFACPVRLEIVLISLQNFLILQNRVQQKMRNAPRQDAKGAEVLRNLSSDPTCLVAKPINFRWFYCCHSAAGRVSLLC
jgi:hypothetical protein